MLRKCLFISAALLLCLATSASARVYWTNGGTDSLWSNADNWGDYTDPDPCIPGDEGTLVPLGREPNLSDGTIFIGQGNGGTIYPPQLYTFAVSGDMVDPTIDSNTTTDIGQGYWGGALSSATFFDPNLHHFLTITANGKISTGYLKMPIGAGGSMVIRNSGDLNVASDHMDLRGTDSYAYYYGEPGSYLMVNVEIMCAQKVDRKARIYLDNAIANCKRLDIHPDADGLVNIKNGGKLIVRQQTDGIKDEGWNSADAWIADGWITGHDNGIDEDGYAHGELMLGTVPLVRCMILTEQVPCGPNDVNNAEAYAGNYEIYKLSGDLGPNLEITAGTGDAYKAYCPDPLDGAGTEGTPLTSLTNGGLNWSTGYNVASQILYYDVNEALVAAGDASVRREAALGAGVTFYDPYATVWGVVDANVYWRVDDVNSDGGTTVGDVWSYQATPGPAMNFSPADDPMTPNVDETQNLLPDLTLSWTAGFGSTSSIVYISTEFDDVNDRTAPNSVAATSHPTGPIDLDTVYYWCVDAISSVVVPGDVLNFETAATVLFDDFDDYVDTTALKGVWSDGYYGSNDSVITLELATAIDDSNSLQLDYRCDLTYSETTAAMSYRDDVNSISAWIYGDAGNDSADVYVGADDGAVVKVQAIAGVDVTLEEWQECRVAFEDLEALGLTLANIESIVIGVGNRAVPGEEGNGTIYVDEVRLYPRRCLAADVIDADFDADCLVQYSDIDMFAQRWLVTKTTPIAPTAVPTLYLPFDEGDGNTVAHDDSGNGYDFNVIGPIVWEPEDGLFGGSVRSTGGNGKLHLADDWQTGGFNDKVKQMFAPAVANNNKVTIMWYMKWDPNETARRNFIFQTEMWDAASSSLKANPLTFRDYTGGGRFEVWMGMVPDPDTGDLPNYGWEFLFDPTFVDELLPDNDVDPSIKGIWYHFAMVKDTDNGVGRIYEDGVQIAQFDDDYRADVNAVRGSIDNICIMGIFNGASAGWSSSMHVSLDEFKIYPEALSEGEIKYILGDMDPFFPNSGDAMNLFSSDDIINFKDYAEVADVWLDDKLWP